jgi:hypothetical protein
MANTQDQSNLIWIEEPKIVYKHSRAWFERRIDLGIFEMVQLIGSTRKRSHAARLSSMFALVLKRVDNNRRRIGCVRST